MGWIMADKFWDFVESRSKSAFRLRKRGRESIRPDREDKPVDDRIRRKTNELPDRFQALFDDILLLHYGGYLQDEDDIWEDIKDIDRHSSAIIDEDIYSPHEEQTNTELQFGLELGRILQLLTESGDRTGGVGGYSTRDCIGIRRPKEGAFKKRRRAIRRIP